MEPNERECPVCATAGAAVDDRDAWSLQVRCRNCGDHLVERRALVDVARLDAVERARLAHALHGLDSGAPLDIGMLHRLLAASALPPAEEQLDNLLMHLAATLRPGEARTLLARDLKATLGSTTDDEARWVLEEARGAGWVTSAAATVPSMEGWTLEDATLSLKGWQRHAELLRSGAKSRHAFMAMKFGDAELDALYREHLEPAVALTGFDLRRTSDDHKTAGNIVNRMRVELRTSRFVVCDLTHGNRGAYWEAGFAEGLGRPVFYLCRRDVLDSADRATRPHFDTAQQLIIGWDPADPAPAMRELKDAIRATLPAEALLDDPAMPR